MTRGKVKKRTKKTEKIIKRLQKTIVSQLVVKNGLYEDYKINPQKVGKKLIRLIEQNKKKIDSGESIIIHQEYSKKIPNAKKLINKLSLSNLKDKEKEILYDSLFTLFLSWIEGIINDLLSRELEIKDIPSQEAYNLLQKINFDDKFGWFLKVLTGKDLRENKIWGEIKRFTALRHFFVHDKPTPEKEQKKRKDITLEELNKLLDLLSKLDKLVKRTMSQELKEQEKKIRELKKS